MGYGSADCPTSRRFDTQPGGKGAMFATRVHFVATTSLHVLGVRRLAGHSTTAFLRLAKAEGLGGSREGAYATR